MYTLYAVQTRYGYAMVVNNKDFMGIVIQRIMDLSCTKVIKNIHLDLFHFVPKS